MIKLFKDDLIDYHPSSLRAMTDEEIREYEINQVMYIIELNRLIEHNKRYPYYG